MARRGYSSEWLAKKQLQKEFGKLNIIKTAIGGAQDFIIAQKGAIIKVVEIKECHKAKYYAGKKEKEQLERIFNFIKEHNITAELWIHYPKKRQWSKLIYNFKA